MYFLFKMGIFQPAMLVYWRIHFGFKSNKLTNQQLTDAYPKQTAYQRSRPRANISNKNSPKNGCSEDPIFFGTNRHTTPQNNHGKKTWSKCTLVTGEYFVHSKDLSCDFSANNTFFFFWNQVTKKTNLRNPTHRTHGTGIFTYIYHKKQPNVDKYTIHGSYGKGFGLVYGTSNIIRLRFQTYPNGDS